jgi:tripartite-type tricarboxylate transporter receptor subunit TctC
VNAEFVKVFNDPKFVAFLEKQSVVTATNTPEQFAAFLKKDRQDAQSLINLANLKPAEYKPAP